MLWRACGCQFPTPGDNLFLLRSNNWAFRVCHSSELVKRLFAVHPGAPDGLDSPCSSSGAARFTLQAFSNSCTFKLFFWQLLCIRAPRLNLAGGAREEGWGQAWQTPQLTGGSSEPELNSAICIHPQEKPTGEAKASLTFSPHIPKSVGICCRCEQQWLNLIALQWFNLCSVLCTGI